jgi:hypothetical protein
VGPWQVEYLCRHRPVWRDAGDFDSPTEAIGRAILLAASSGRPVRVIDALGRQLWPEL